MTDPAIQDVATRPAADHASPIADARHNVLTAIESIDLRLYHAATMHLHRAAHNLSYAAKDPPQPPAPITTEQLDPQAIVRAIAGTNPLMQEEAILNTADAILALSSPEKEWLTHDEMFATPPVTMDRAAVIEDSREAMVNLARSIAIEECAKLADSFRCGGCGMDGKVGAAIRSLLNPK